MSLRKGRLVPMPPARPRRAPAEPAEAPAEPLLPPRQRAIPPLRWPLQRHDVAALLFTLALVGVAWDFRHVILFGAGVVYTVRIGGGRQIGSRPR